VVLGSRPVLARNLDEPNGPALVSTLPASVMRAVPCARAETWMEDASGGVAADNGRDSAALPGAPWRVHPGGGFRGIPLSVTVLLPSSRGPRAVLSRAGSRRPPTSGSRARPR